MADSSCDFGIDFHRKIDDFYSKKHSFLLECRRRYSFDCKKHWFSDGNRSQNRMKNPSKIIKILIYVGNVYSDAGKRGECMGTFLGSYSLEKRPKSHGVSENSITIGIPIQMVIRRCLPSRLRLGPRRSFARKTTYRKNYCELSGPLRDLGRRRCPSSLALGAQCRSCNERASSFSRRRFSFLAFCSDV